MHNSDHTLNSILFKENVCSKEVRGKKGVRVEGGEKKRWGEVRRWVSEVYRWWES